MKTLSNRCLYLTVFSIMLTVTSAGFLAAQEAHDHHMHSDVEAAPAQPLMSSPVQMSDTSVAPLQAPLPQSSTPIGSPVAPPAAVGDENIETSPSAPTQPAAGMFHRLEQGGPAIWAIAALSVLALTVILWILWRFILIGAWSRGRMRRAVEMWESGEFDAARTMVSRAQNLRAKVLRSTFIARTDLPEESAREETSRVARNALADASSGLRVLELISTIAPLLGLLGTVLGMIAAFQTLQQSGNRADPSMLAGGIWEALLTTAAGMAVAIPASVTLTWFEAVIERMRRDIEDAATRIFIAKAPDTSAL
ncbi:MotA/TolQ/ExbB proton channel family protein [Lentibacter sp. XHP0401]|uniref:MotA/TolQ/ExbB proton channel family protein n=1 Tax=Lentibacter sp. XHP0401 TaxID=2984334 RepID=UPI0021E7A579|nr:MotA/TolQ/ExbB proton channel family protein [Lentibacter sp. XHP0401]MCV2892764.1 MotA/TolQ/ExbB proton channel family protein [Lentibacter sp. XHP0401]